MMDKKASKIKVRRRGKELLTKDDLTIIRSALPKNWRLLIHQMQDCISLRQITEVFNQRTTDPASNLVVWRSINKLLRKAKQPAVAEKVKKPLSFYADLYNVIQKHR